MSDQSFDTDAVGDRVYGSFLAGFQSLCRVCAIDHQKFCESPIELMLLAAFQIRNLLWSSKDREDGDVFRIARNNGEPDFSRSVIWGYPQFKWRDYRIDLKLEIKDFGGPLFIECDGHEFHERSKDQAERDRRRDREIQEAGIPILRFTGREIYRDPETVVDQILKFIIEREIIERERAKARGAK